MAFQMPLSGLLSVPLLDCLEPTSSITFRAALSDLLSDTLNASPGTTFFVANSTLFRLRLSPRASAVGYQSPVNCEKEYFREQLLSSEHLPASAA